MKRTLAGASQGCLLVAAFTLTVGFASGCVQYQAQPIVPEQAAARFEARTLDDVGLAAFLAANQAGSAWDLNRLTLAAFYFHPELDVARAELASARAAKTTAAESPNPAFSFTPTYDSSVIVNPWTIAGQFSVPIETADKRGKRMAVAECLSQAARLRIAAQAWGIRSHVRQALVALQVARENLRLLNRQQELQVEVARLVEAQKAAGSVSEYDVAEARILAQQSRLAVRDMEVQAAAALAQLAEAVGVPEAALEGVTLVFEPLGAPATLLSDGDARRRAVTQRADLLAVLAEYAADEAKLQLEIARQFPDVSLGPGYELDQTENKWSLGFAVELPVVNQNQGPIAEALAHRDETAARFNALQARVFGKIDAARAACRTTLLKREDAEVLRREAEGHFRAAEARFKAGEISRLDMVLRESQMNAARLAELGALAQWQRALGNLEDALQGARPLADTALRLSPSPAQGAVENARP